MRQISAKREKYKIPLFCILTMLFWASLYSYVPIFTPYLENLGASHKITGLIVGSYGFFQLILRIPIGILSDKFHKRKLVITFGMSFTLISTIGFLITKNLSLILLFRSFAGAAAATWVDFTVLFSGYYKLEESTKAVGIMNFSCLFGETIAMFIGGLAADSLGWSAPFQLSIVFGITGMVFCLFIFEKSEEKKQNMTIRGFMEVASDKTLIMVSLLAILCQLLTFATVFGFTPLYADTILHSNKFQLSILTVFSTIPIALASLAAGLNFVLKIGEKKMIVVGFVLAGIFTIAVPFSKSLAILIITQIIAGIGKGLTLSLLMGLSIKNMEPEKRGTAMGIFQSVYGLGIFIGPIFMGIIGDYASLQQGFIYTGISGLIAALLSYILLKYNNHGLQVKKQSA